MDFFHSDQVATLLFMESLSEEQKTLFAKVQPGHYYVPATPPPAPPSPPPVPEGTGHWYNLQKAGRATASEVLLLSALLVMSIGNDAAVLKWVQHVESDAARINALGDEWCPLADDIWNSKEPKVSSPHRTASHHCLTAWPERALTPYSLAPLSLLCFCPCCASPPDRRGRSCRPSRTRCTCTWPRWMVALVPWRQPPTC